MTALSYFIQPCWLSKEILCPSCVCCCKTWWWLLVWVGRAYLKIGEINRLEVGRRRTHFCNFLLSDIFSPFRSKTVCRWCIMNTCHCGVKLTLTILLCQKKSLRHLACFFPSLKFWSCCILDQSNLFDCAVMLKMWAGWQHLAIEVTHALNPTLTEKYWWWRISPFPKVKSILLYTAYLIMILKI